MEVMISKSLSTGLVVFFFLLVVVFLRYLYGPGGRLRDPQWDRWNEEARRKLEREHDAKADKRLTAAFLAYARSFFSADPVRQATLQLKIDHTFRVCAHADELIAAEPALADYETARALKLAALFHDVGRFEQFSQYGTFSDALSCNHGTLGARIVLGQKFLSGEAPEVRRLAVGAIAAHNRLRISPKVSGKFLLVLQALRDCDKLDIMRVLADHLEPGAQADDAVLLHLADDPAAWTPSVLAALQEGHSAQYSDMRYYNDFRIMLCSWLPELHFAASRAIVRRSGHIERLIQGLAQAPEAQRQVEALTAPFLKS